MAKPKKKEVMGRTIIVIDKETKKLWTKAAEKMEMSNSEYIRILIREVAEKNRKGNP